MPFLFIQIFEKYAISLNGKQILDNPKNVFLATSTCTTYSSVRKKKWAEVAKAPFVYGAR